MLTLTKDMETGIAQVDAQHREIVDKVNTLVALGEKSQSEQEVLSTLTFLAEYALQHFKTEEDLMKACDYPAFYVHEGQHKYFVEKFLAFKSRLDEAGHNPTLSSELTNFIISWIVHHIKVSDTAFGEFYLNTAT